MSRVGIFIDATTGNLGIGTSAPRQYFDIQGGNAIISGNVGIGTIFPTHKLHIYSTSRLDNDYESAGIFLENATQGEVAIAFRNSNVASTGNIWSIGLNSNSTRFDIGYGPQTTHLADNLVNFCINTSGNIGIGTTIARQLLDVQGGNAIVSGNIGIGSTTPSNKLDVIGNAYVSGNIGIGITNPNAILQIASGTLTLAPIRLTSGINLTTTVAGSIEYDGTNTYITPNTNYGRATVPATIYTSGVSGTTGITLNTDYAIFPATNDSITLSIGTYLVKLAIQVSVATSTVDSVLTINIRGGGNAVGNFSWRGVGAITANGATSSFPVAATTLGTAFTVTPTSAVSGRVYVCIGEGILKITTGGTIIPSYRWPVTLTSGVVTLDSANYMIIQSLDTQSAAAFGPAGCGFN